MAREVEARLKLSAVDRTARAFNAVERRLQAVNKKAAAVNRAQAAVARTMDGALLASARYLAPAVIAAGTAGAVKRFASVERAVNRIGITAGASAQDTKAAFAVIDRAAHDYAMGQDEITAGLDSLVASGRSLESSLSFLPSVAATAQAAGADIVSIATTADAVGNNFDIAGDKMQEALDILVNAGKLGKFELKDMASYLPTLTPAFEALGYKGEYAVRKIAASLQVVRNGTGSAGEAATAFSNVLQKMETNETVKRFSEFGINLNKEMARARKEGRDLIDVFVELTNKAIKGDLSKLPQLFGDAQMITGMRALLNGTPELTRYMTELGNSTGSVAADLERILGDNQTKIDRMTASWDKLVKSFGEGAVSAGGADLMDSVSNAIDYHTAVNTGLEKRGITGWWERTKWGLGSSQEEKNLAAYEGGWRSTPLSGKGPMSASPELPSRRQDAVSSGAIPVPQARPDPRLPLPDLRYDQFAPIGAGYVANLERREMANWQKQREERYAANVADLGKGSDFFRIPSKDDVKNALAIDMSAYREGGEAVAEGGRTAGQEIEKSAAFFKVAGVDVGQAIMSAAAKLSEAANRLSSVSVNVNTANMGGARSVNADRGRSMPPSVGVPPGGGP